MMLIDTLRNVTFLELDIDRDVGEHHRYSPVPAQLQQLWLLQACPVAKQEQRVNYVMSVP